MTVVARAAARLLVCCLALSAMAQSTPAPPAVESPLTSYVGRYLDSGTTLTRVSFPTTRRARMVKIAPERDRIYMIIGSSTFVGQPLSTFANRVATEPLQTVPGAPPVFGEKFLAFQQSFDAQDPGSGWPVVGADGSDRLMDFDWDDRGLTLLAYGAYGWGIIDSNFNLVSLEVGVSFPQNIVTFRNGSTYYALVSDFVSSRLYNVTNAASPLFIRSSSPYGEFAKSADGRIAIVHGTNLEIHTPASLANNTAAVLTLTAPAGSAYIDVTTDGTNFYALQNLSAPATPDVIHILKPSGATYIDTPQAVSAGHLSHIAYGAGYLVSHGPANAIDTLSIYRVDAAGLTLLNDTYFDWEAAVVFAQYYIGQPVMVNGQVLLIVADHGIGDVFALAAPSPLTMTKQFSPPAVPRNTESQLTVTITNPNPTPVSSFGLTDNYPAGLVNGSSPSSTTCGGTVTAPAGGPSFTLAGAMLAANSSCSVTVSVTAATMQSYVNTIPAGAILSADNTNAAPASATLVVNELQAPAAAKSFNPAGAAIGQLVRLTITLTNPNASTITGVAFTDNYPAGLANASPANAATTCGGTVTAPNGGLFLSLAGGSIAASSNCTVSADVMLTANNAVTNVLPAGAVTSANAAPSSGAASAVLAAQAGGAPTLSEWALIALVTMLGMVAVLRLRA